MTYGDGTITKLGKDHYEVRFDFSTGNKRRQIKRRVRGPRSAAVRLRDELRRQRDGGLKIDGSNTSLTEMIEEWMNSRKLVGKASERTIRSERNALRHVEKYIGNDPVCAIDAQMIERTYISIKEEIGLSGTTLRQIHYSLKSVFEKAIDYGCILRNPCDRVTAPSRSKSNRVALSVEETARLLRCVDEAEVRAYFDIEQKEIRQLLRGKDESRDFIRGIVVVSYILAVRIAIATGMRRGEVFALTWKAFDAQSNTVNVYQSLTDTGAIKDPKTEAGYRTINIDSGTARHLRTWKQFQEIMLSRFDVEQTGLTPICCSNVGGFVNLSNFEHWWKSFRAEIGFEDLRYHELRHTQATQLLANGMDLRTVKDRLGHASAAVTMGYTHSIAENDVKAAELIGDLFSQSQSAQNKEDNIAVIVHDTRKNVSNMCQPSSVA